MQDLNNTYQLLFDFKSDWLRHRGQPCISARITGLEYTVCHYQNSTGDEIVRLYIWNLDTCLEVTNIDIQQNHPLFSKYKELYRNSYNVCVML